MARLDVFSIDGRIFVEDKSWKTNRNSIISLMQERATEFTNQEIKDKLRRVVCIDCVEDDPRMAWTADYKLDGLFCKSCMMDGNYESQIATYKVFPRWRWK